jgi:AcrR family transcriptional regulator
MPEEQRALVLETAAHEFARAGFAQASVNAIMASSGLGKSSFYWAFDDKEDLFLTVMRARVPLVFSSSIDDAKDAPFWESIERFTCAICASAVEDPLLSPLARAFYELLPRSPQARKLLDDIEAQLTRQISAGQSQDVVRRDLPPTILAKVTLGMLTTLALSADAESETAVLMLDPERSTALTLDLLRRLLVPSLDSRKECEVAR